MGANAAGVVARVLRRPDPDGTHDRGAGPFATLTIWSAVLAISSLAIVVGGLAAILWSGHRSAREIAVANAAGSLDLIARLAAQETREIVGDGTPLPEHLGALARSLPPIALTRGRAAYLSDASGYIVGHTPATDMLPPVRLVDLFSSDARADFSRGGQVVRTTLRDGTGVLATVRSLRSGHLTLIQPDTAVSAEPLTPVYGHPALAIAVTLGLMGLGAGCLHYRRHAEDARKACTRLTSRVDTSLVRGRSGYFDWDLARKRVFWSASMYELLGYEPRDEHLSTNEVEALLQPEHDTFQALLDGIAANPGLVRDHDVRARTANGQCLWLRVKAELVIDPVEGTRHVVGFATDVTDERGQAERRAEADGRLRDAVEAISEAFVLWDAERRLVLCNSKFLNLYELPPELARPGTPHGEILAAARRPIAVTRVAGTRDPGVRTLETQLSDGRWLQVNERRTKDGGIVSVGTDVSALKRSEAKLRERERRLQGSVLEAESEKQRLAVVAERSIEANQAKTEFLARMSHELRTPLNAIIGFADMMRNEILGPLGCGRYAEYSRDIHASGLKLAEVIDGILQMSRIEQGQVPFSPELIAVSDLVQDAVAALEAEGMIKGLTFETDVAPPALIYADRRAMSEVLIQLIENAVRFTSPFGRVRIRVRPSGGRLHIFVEDDGVGIPADILPALGRPFEQVEAEYSRASGGTGLGLAIARALVELHGGRLRLRSQPGTGTIALVAIPVVQPAANDPEVLETAARPRPTLVAAE